MKHKIKYSHTDLALKAPVDLTSLADALAQGGLITDYVFQHEDGLWSACFQAYTAFIDLDQDIVAMLTAIEALDESTQSLWGACTVREFDICFDSGEEPGVFTQQLPAATIARMAAAGAAINISLFPLIETAPIEAAVEVLKKDKSIIGHIGKYITCGFEYVVWSSLKRDLAEVKVTLYGEKDSFDSCVYVYCKMELNEQEEWILKEIINKEERIGLPIS